MKSIIETSNLCKSYASEGQQMHILKNIDLKIYEGQFTVIMGPSGSGKSTLLYMLSGMDSVTSGTVSICGELLRKQNDKETARFRQETTGLIFQQMNLLSHMTCLENICTAGYLKKGRSRRKTHEEARDLLERVGIPELSGRLPSQMSGGQQQRAGIARAFVSRPEVVFADEPTGNLDTKTTAEIMDMVMGFARRFNQTIILVTHDPGMSRYADRIVTLVDGIITGDERKGQ